MISQKMAKIAFHENRLTSNICRNVVHIRKFSDGGHDDFKPQHKPIPTGSLFEA